MPNFTPVFGLPYPSGSDRPCDFDEQWCDFTEAIDAVFTDFETGLARTNPVIPMALVRQTGPVTVGNTISIPYDTVVVDTAGMTDIDADPFSITITRPGRYTVNGFLELADPNIAINAEITMSILGSSFASAETIYRGVIQYRMTAYNAVETLAAGTKLQMFFNVGTAGTEVVSGAWWSAAWHSDTEVP